MCVYFLWMPILYFDVFLVIGLLHVKVERNSKNAIPHCTLNSKQVNLVRRFRRESPSQVQSSIITDTFLCTLYPRKHGKWKLRNGFSRTANKFVSRHGLWWIQCRKSNCIQHKSCFECCRTERSKMLKMYAATERTATSNYVRPSLLQELHRTTDKWKVHIIIVPSLLYIG